MAPRTTKTPEQRAQEMQDLYGALDAQVAALASAQGWAAYLAAAAAFPQGCLDSCLLVAAQRPGATSVATYQTWQGAGRQVRRGEKSIVVLGSRTMAVRPTEDQDGAHQGRHVGAIEHDEAGAAVRRISYPVRVFDIAQTDPIAGAQQAPRLAADLAARDGAGLYARTIAYFARQSITMRRLVVPGAGHGLCRKIPPAGSPLAPEWAWVNEVVIDVRRTGADAAHAALHQGAHIAAGHLDAEEQDYVTHRGPGEIEASAAAAIVAALAGLESPTSGYAPGWMQAAKEDDLKATAAAALASARTLATCLELIENPQPATTAAA